MNPTNHHQAVEALRALGDDAFVMKAYLALLGRAPDPGGAADYTSRLRAGVPRIQIWTEISDGQEARDFAHRKGAASRSPGMRGGAVRSLSELLGYDGVEFVREAYRCVLGREADPGGLRDYSTRLASGSSKRQLLADLRCDPEGQAFAAPVPGLDDLVLQVQAGLNAGVDSMSLDDLLALLGEAFVRAAYVVLFKREADPEGLARYVELLRSGFSTMHVLKALHASPEAREKSAILPGLTPAIRSYDKAQLRSWKGWYHRAVCGAPSEFPSERQLRAMAYRLLEAKK